MEKNDENQVKEKNLKVENKILIVSSIVLLLFLIALLLYIFLPKSSPVKQEVKDFVIPLVKDEVKEPVILSTDFAQYKELPISLGLMVPPYTVNADLSNIENAKHYNFSDGVKNLLVKNAFAVSPAHYEEFFQIYEANRYDSVPSFITTDSILHNYHLLFDFLLKQLEEQELTRELKNLNVNMLAESLNQYNNLKGSEWENAAKRNIGFFAVGSKLLDPTFEIPKIVKQEVDIELDLIEAHIGSDPSAIMNIGVDPGVLIETPQGLQSPEMFNEDYSQYIPRGHYDKSEELKAYFKSMMWYGRLSFKMKNKDEVKSALLITLALGEKNNSKSWDKIYEPINFFVGKSDDITYYQFKDLVGDVYGQKIDLISLSSDENNFNKFIKKTKELEAPKINSMPIFDASSQDDRDNEIKAFRFLGQRYTVDADIFQRLIYREVGDKTTNCKDFDSSKATCMLGARCLPQGLDIPATMGSQEAKNILVEMGETKYACYLENMSKMSQYVSGLDINTWTQNLYWGWLYQIRPLLDKKQAGHPSFMLNEAWQRKELNTYLASWSELKHDTILYAKQVYAELGGSGPDKKDDRGYVEPNPHVYSRLASLLKMTGEGLETRDLLSSGMKDNLSNMEKLAVSLKTISEKELKNEKLQDEEYELIRSYGGQLEHLWLDINKNEKAFKESTGSRDYLSENPASIIADVATDPNGQVLEVGTGPISEIYVVVPVDGKLRIAKGGVYSYYEFVWPMSDRLTNQKWRALLYSDESPERPFWTESFTSSNYQ